MARLVPFAALRPMVSSAARVAAVPYDVVSVEEARTLANEEPLSFLHVSRAEVDLPPGTNPYSDEVYAKAVTNMEGLKRRAPMLGEDEPSLYVYRLVMNGHAQTGIAGGFSLDEYEGHLIKRHERTRKDKEDDRTRHIVELRAQTGPVFLVHRPAADVQSITTLITATTPIYDFEAHDGIRHTLWRASGSESSRLQDAFAAIDALYIADGHHRAASAARARRQLGTPAEFLAVAFPSDEVQILPYNRVVLDLGTYTPATFLALLRERFGAVDGAPQPSQRGHVSVFVSGQWYRVSLKDEQEASTDLRLDVSRLHHQILEPVLGIGDVTRDKRIDFVGGGRGPQALERLVREGHAAAAFSMYPVGIEDIVQVSDAGGIMPPKSTWFEPKLRDGLLSYLF